MTLPFFEYLDVPDGYRTFKCATPGCKRPATMMVELRHTMAHLKDRRRCYCNSCGWAVAQQERERIREECMETNAPVPHLYEFVVDGAPTGLHLYRKREDASGGWRGWTYMVALDRTSIHARECPNPWALRDGDGNWIIRE